MVCCIIWMDTIRIPCAAHTICMLCRLYTVCIVCLCACMSVRAYNTISVAFSTIGGDGCVYAASSDDDGRLGGGNGDGWMICHSNPLTSSAMPSHAMPCHAKQQRKCFSYIAKCLCFYIVFYMMKARNDVAMHKYAIHFNTSMYPNTRAHAQHRREDPAKRAHTRSTHTVYSMILLYL